MRVLHVIARGHDLAAIRLVRGICDAGVACLVLARDGSPAIVRAASLGLPTLAAPGPDGAEPGAEAGLLKAVASFRPHLIHMHGGAACADFHLPDIVRDRIALFGLTDDDLDPAGMPRGEWAVGQGERIGLLMPAAACRDATLLWRHLPRRVGSIAWAGSLPITQCAELYGCLLSSPPKGRAAPASPVPCCDSARTRPG